MGCVAMGGLSVVCCKGKYSEPKLPVNFTARYFSARSRSLRQKELREFPPAPKHAAFSVYFSEVSLSVMLCISHKPFWDQTCQKHCGATCPLPLPVCIDIGGIRTFGRASRYLPRYWQGRAVTLQACLLPWQRTDTQRDSPSAKKSELICIVREVPRRILLFQALCRLAIKTVVQRPAVT